MKLVFLPSTKTGLRWFHRYYTAVFREGKSNADRHFLAMKKTLASSPEIGRPVGVKNYRIYMIPRTPFSVIYRIAGDRVEIVGVLDQRAEGLPGDE